MKNNINIKSALIGMAIGVTATLGIGAAGSPGNPVGRYQVAGAGNHAVIIDTTTGRAWRSFLNPNGGAVDADFVSLKN